MSTLERTTTIGVIIPTYNRPELLGEALTSVQAQSWPAWRAFVIDDASTLSYASAQAQVGDDDRIEFIRKDQNEGINAARNVGIERALDAGVDFLIFLDDDDVFADDYFETVLQQVDKHPAYGWFMSNNCGERKSSTRDIVGEGEMDFVDDYIYRKFRGDKAHLFAAPLLRDVRMDARFRSSHRWGFYIKLATKTKIWAFPHPSIRKHYLEGGITRSSTGKRPKSLREVTHRFAKHWYVIRVRPTKLAAYKYFLLELVKTPGRLIRLLWR